MRTIIASAFVLFVMVTAVAQEPPLTQSGTVAVAVENMPEQPAQNIYRVPWNREQMLPFIITCSPDDTVLIELPYPAVAWHGRGFIPQDVTRTGQDSQQPVLGDFAIYPGNVSGEKIISITALVEKSARTLHIVMEENRLLTLECLVAESRNNAFRAVVFIDNLAQSQRVENAVREERTRVTSFIRSDEPPISKYQEPSAETQLGLKNFMKALLSVDEERALSLLRANPAIQFNFPKGAGAQAFDYGLYTITQRFVLRDAVTDTLGLCVAMKNNSASRLLFDPAGWVLRAGDHIYPVPTVEFSGEIEPGQATTAFLIIARDVNGRPTRLLPTTPMQVSAKIVGAVNPRPLIMEAVDVH